MPDMSPTLMRWAGLYKVWLMLCVRAHVGIAKTGRLRLYVYAAAEKIKKWLPPWYPSSLLSFSPWPAVKMVSHYCEWTKLYQLYTTRNR